MKMEFRTFESKDIAKAYVLYRPYYPDDMYKSIVAYCEEGGGGKTLAVDAACGNGQSTWPLSPYFEQVIGVDISEAQLAEAPKNYPNITYRQGPAEDLHFLEDNSVDLVTCATSAHWLDKSRFYKEVDRVLKPAGCLVIYGYGHVKMTNPKANTLLEEVSCILYF